MSHVTRISTSHFDDTGLSEWVRHMREGSTGGNSQLAAQLNQISIGFVTYQSALLHICIIHKVFFSTSATFIQNLLVIYNNILLVV